MNSVCPQSCRCRLNSIMPDNTPPAYHIYKQIPVFLGGNPGTERVVIYSSNTEMKAIAQIQKFNESTNNWITEYQKETGGIPYFNVSDGYWEAVMQNIAILYYSAGSGGYLYYTVVGRRGGKLVELVNRQDIYQGNVWLDGGKLIEAYGNRYRLWTSRNGRLTLIPYRLPVIPGALVIDYSIIPDGRINISKTGYTVKTGAMVQVIRTDLNSITERILYSYTPNARYIPHSSGFKFIGRGTMEFTIIPDGYDWAKAVKVTVTAE